MLTSTNSNDNEALFDYCVKLGDDRLILGQRLGELCGHAPILEEDIALTNIALDEIGMAVNFYKYAVELEGKGRSEDDLAFFRDSMHFKNLTIVEQPNEDFAYTIMRQFIFDSYSYFLFEELINSKDSQIKAIAEKSIKEIKYHLRHSSQWILRLGDGTEESHSRIQDALGYLWQFTNELFENDENDLFLSKSGFAPDLSTIKQKWEDYTHDILLKATLTIPSSNYRFTKGGRHGIHTEYLDYILSEMQILPRTYPDAKW